MRQRLFLLPSKVSSSPNAAKKKHLESCQDLGQHHTDGSGVCTHVCMHMCEHRRLLTKDKSRTLLRSEKVGWARAFFCDVS